MPRRRTEGTAAGLLGTWTDADTAMQIVGTSLGVFGAGLLEPDAVLSHETPLRNALFDILLTLVEGGALEMRPADGGFYAFRWRADIATAGLSTETTRVIDVEPPSPYVAQVERVTRERDEALRRADVAEALAQERERLLRLASVPVPATRVEPAAAPAEPARPLDPEGQSVLDVLYASRRSGPAPDEPGSDTADENPPAPGEQARGGGVAKPSDASDVVYLPPAVTDDEGPKWSGYRLDKPRPRLSTVDYLADEA